jgi:Arc/MetJ family transcription regulator
VGVRLHINLDDGLVAELDSRVGPRRRSAFVASAVRAALEDERRWELIESSFGSIPDTGHEWDDDPAAWVRSQRRADERRVG